MSAELRHEQECSQPGCPRPAHIGDLCGPCFYASSPARRQVELDCDVAGAAVAAAARERRELEALYRAPGYGEAA